MITFVIFHVELEKRAGPGESVEDSCDFNELTEIAFRSATLFHPNCRKVLLTDEHTEFHLSSDIEIIRKKIDPEALMLSRMRCQVEFLEQQNPQSHFVFLDSDIVINGSLEELFANDFEVGLTYVCPRNRDSFAERMPINGGLFFFKGSQETSALNFMKGVYSCYQEETVEGYEHWWGDQNALMEFVGRDRFSQRESDSLSVGDLQIMLLPAEEYNFSPRNEMKNIRRPYAEKKVLHFRGPRKRLMLPYWNLYLAPRENPSLKQKVLAFWERVKLSIGIIEETFRNL